MIWFDLISLKFDFDDFDLMYFRHDDFFREFTILAGHSTNLNHNKYIYILPCFPFASQTSAIISMSRLECNWKGECKSRRDAKCITVIVLSSDRCNCSQHLRTLEHELQAAKSIWSPGSLLFF